MQVHIHRRPMILPKINGMPNADNQFEVDVWLEQDGVSEIICEYVCKDKFTANLLMLELQEAFTNSKLVKEE